MPDHTRDERLKIQTLRNMAGWSYNQISETLKIPKSTVVRLCRVPTTPQKQNRSGRKPKTTSPILKLEPVDLSDNNDCYRRMHWASKDAAKELGCDFGQTADAYAKEDCHCRSAPASYPAVGRDLANIKRETSVDTATRHETSPTQRKPDLSFTEKLERIKFCFEHRDWDASMWRRVIWTNECYIWLSDGCGTVHVTRREEEEYLEGFKDSIIIWAGILGDGGGRVIVIWEKDERGTMNARDTVQIYTGIIHYG
ncbi:hypothetical protein EDC01DRAFT_634631 [Geopyxis carbonaria]|nr:hypothetical protein EDC01DRAFT_634631 [Geopyxis carbonaria]